MKIFLYILLFIIPCVFTCYFDIKIFLENKTKANIIKTIFKDFFLINLLSLSSLVLCFRYDNIFYPNKHNYLFFLVFGLMSFLFGGLYLLIKYLINKYFIKEKVELKKKGGAITLYCFSIFFMFLGTILITLTIWGENTYYSLDFIQILITIFSPGVGTDPVIILSCIEQAFLTSVTITYLFSLIYYQRLNYKLKKNPNSKFYINNLSRQIFSIVLSFSVLISGFSYTAYAFNFKKFIVSMTQKSSYIEENYYDPMNVKMEFPHKKRNIIHFYLESVENSYFDRENGGNMKENLMPELLKVTDELIKNNQAFNFSHLAKGKGYGGPLETEGATWSVASMVNQFFGVPMKTPTSQNTYGKEGEFFKGAVGVGDILAKAGYNQTIMLGADSTFGGLSYMFDLHGKFKDMDYKYAKNHNMLPSKDYNVNWGFEDEKLYKFAKDEIIRLANQKDENGNSIPFHFMFENADTHFPGFVFNDKGEPMFGASGKKDYAKTISFSDKGVAEFISWIMKQPFYKDTTIVIIGDHLSMDKNFFTKENFPDFLRTTYNLIINPDPSLDLTDESRFYNRKWASYDMMPTLLSAMGIKIEGNRLGIGTNLFSDLPTVFERDGYEYVNNIFIKKSPFYNKVLLNTRRNYDGKNLIFN